jgi:hypothetical protein
MKDASRFSGNDIDDGWDDMVAPPSIATRSLAPPPELAALDEGWSDVAHSAPQASIAPVSKINEVFPIASTIPPTLDELDDGWSDVFDESAPAPSRRHSAVSPVKSPGKKERKQLERERRIKQTRAKKERSEKRREARREEQKQKPSEPSLRATPQEKKRILCPSEERSDRQSRQSPQNQTKPKVVITEDSLARNAPVSTPSHRNRVTSVWLLWIVLVTLLLGIGYLVTRL